MTSWLMLLAIVLVLGAAIGWLFARRTSAVRQSEERYALAMEAAGDGHTDWNLQTGEHYISPRLLQICGYAPGTKFHDREEWVQSFPFHAEDRPKWEQAIAAHFAGREAHFMMELRIVVHGEVRWTAFHFLSTRDAAGRPIRWTGSIADITEQKRAEVALRESQERYELAMAASESGYWDWHIPTGLYFSSARASEMVGLPAENTYTNRNDFRARIPVHPEDWARWDAAREELFAGTGERLAMEVRYIMGGETRWHSFQAICKRDETGKVVRWTGSTTDVTERKRVEEALQLSEARYALAMEGAEEGHFDWNVQTGEAFFSPTALRLLNVPQNFEYRTRREVMAHARFHPDDWLRAAEEWRAVLAGRRLEPDFEYRVMRGKEPRWIRGRWQVFRDAGGVVQRVIGVISDVTERKRVEAALRLSEERYSLAMEAAEDAHWDYIIGTDDYYTSPRVVDVFGLPPGTTFTSRQDYLAKTPLVKEDLDAWLRATRELFAGTGSRLSMDLRAIVHGEIRWIQHHGVCFRDASGKAVRWCGTVRDTTDRHRAEEEMRLSGQRNAVALEVSEEGTWDWNVQTDEFFASPQTLKVYGVPQDSAYRTRADALGNARFHPEDWPRVSVEWSAALAGRGVKHEFEYRILRGGEPRWIQTRWKVFRDDAGVAQRVIGVVADITARKLAEEALRRSEEGYALAMEAAQDAHWDWDIVKGDYYVSPRTMQLHGFPEGTKITSREQHLALQPYLPEENAAWVRATAELFAGTGDRLSMEQRAVVRGEIRWFQRTGVCRRDAAGKVIRWSGSVRDVTDRKRAEEELRSRQEMLELAQKSARAVAFEWKIGGTDSENRWTPDHEAMYGLAAGAFDGKYETYKKLIYPEDWPAAKKAFQHALSTGDLSTEYRVVHPDGAAHWLQVQGRMFFDVAGKPARAVGFIQDVTQRKQAEEEMRKMELELRRAQRLEAIGTLAGGIAHDFNNILGAILGYGEMAMRDAKRGTRLRRDLDSIVAAGERGRSLVDRILAFSRSSVGERIPVHVQAIVREALDQAAASLPRNVSITTRLRAGRAAMLGDSTQVHQVVMNLVSNAVQAMPKGGVLRVALETACIDEERSAVVGSVVPGEYILLRVTDTGDGIPDDVLERIFDPFFTTKEVGTGSGLGLSLVHGIVTSVDGAIDVASELRKGSVFTVYLRRSGDAPEKPVDQDRPLHRGEGQRVLVVDDEEPLVRLATETLESLGYAPVGFTSSTAALAAFRADPGRFDAVLTDERMPGLSGSALIREVRGIREAIPVVLMSGYVGMESVGADVVVRKPLSARDLAASMARALEP